MIERRLRIEQLERRLPLASDFGDAPAPYDTLLADNGARHEAVGPLLGATRDTEADGQPTLAADGDGSDDDGVTFGTIRVGQLGATITVNVQNAPTGAKLDAWIDFNGDGSWSGAHENIAANLAVVEGDNLIKFDVPVDAISGSTYARFRLSTVGDLNVTGAAVDGEVEDYLIEISPPRTTIGFVPTEHVIDVPTVSSSYHVVDLDGDGDQDLISSGSTIRWLENDGAGNMTEHTLPAPTGNFVSIAGDLDLDGDIDIISVSPGNGRLCWFKNDGNQGFTQHLLPNSTWAKTIELADWDNDGDMDIISVGPNRGFIAYVNDGNQVFTQQVVNPSINGSFISGIYAVHPIDMDRDGDLDVVAAGENGDGITWYQNNGSQQFTEQAYLSFGSINTLKMTPRDMDADGDVDIVFAFEGSGTDALGWYENDGAQNFTRRIISYDILYPTDISVADVNGDGHQDVLVYSDSMKTMELFAGSEIGNFTRSLIVDSTDGYNFTAPIIADMDADGDLDVVSSDRQKKVVWNEAYPTAYRAEVTLAAVVEDSGVSSSVTFTRTGDASPEETFAYTVHGSATFGTDYTVSGAASFATTTGSVTFLAGERTATIIITPVADGDFEGDELIRIRTAHYADIGLSEQDGNPTDAAITILHDEPQDFGDAPDTFHTTSGNNGASHGAGGPNLGATRDAEADGQPSANADGDGSDDDGVTFGTIRVGQQDAFVTVNVENAPTGARLDAWFDFDGDGNFAGAWEQVAASVAVVNGDNQIAIDVPSTIASGEVVARFRLSTAGGASYLGHSVDGEVEDYVVTISPPATSEGIFSSRTPISTTSTNAQGAVMADLDGDGDLDVISTDSNSIDWYENQGGDQFIPHQVAVVANGNSVKAIDLDRDGDLDLLAISRGYASVYWYENDGNQMFVTHNINSLTDQFNDPEEMYAADIDGDGDLDVLVTNGQNTNNAWLAVWFKNDGLQNFSPLIPIVETYRAYSFGLGDVNRDGFIDIVTTTPAESAFGRFSVMINDGLGNFTIGHVGRALPGNASIAVADFDGDGDNDVSLSMPGFSLMWLENLGDGIFDEIGSVIDNTAAFSSVVPSDVNGDGHMDILATSSNTDKAYWYRNNGAVDPTFTRIEIGTTGRTPWSIFPGDIDGDGDLDVVTASRTAFGNRVEWFENIPANSGDFDGDGDVDGRDMLLWQRGQSSSPLGTSDLSDWQATYGYVAPVPEFAAIVAEEVASATSTESETGFPRHAILTLPTAGSRQATAFIADTEASEALYAEASDQAFAELSEPSRSLVRDFGDIATRRSARIKPRFIAASLED
jgi:hypothetical protein